MTELDLKERHFQSHDVMQAPGQMNAVFSSQVSKYGPSHPQSVKIIQQGIIKHHRITFKGHRLKVTKSILKTIHIYTQTKWTQLLCKCF